MVATLRCPVNVLAMPGTPPIADLAAAGVRRVSTGSSLAARAYGELLSSAAALRGDGTAANAEGALSDAVRAAFRSTRLPRDKA